MYIFSISFIDILCDEPEKTESGFNVVVQGYKVGDAAIYSCAEGQTMEGDEKRFCQKTGVWGGIPPKCTCK